MSTSLRTHALVALRTPLLLGVPSDPEALGLLYDDLLTHLVLLSSPAAAAASSAAAAAGGGGGCSISGSASASPARTATASPVTASASATPPHRRSFGDGTQGFDPRAPLDLVWAKALLSTVCRSPHVSSRTLRIPSHPSCTAGIPCPDLWDPSLFRWQSGRRPHPFHRIPSGLFPPFCDASPPPPHGIGSRVERPRAARSRRIRLDRPQLLDPHQRPHQRDPHTRRARDRTARDRTARDRTARDRTARDRTARDPTARDPTARDPTARDRAHLWCLQRPH